LQTIQNMAEVMRYLYRIEQILYCRWHYAKRNVLEEIGSF